MSTKFIGHIFLTVLFCCGVFPSRGQYHHTNKVRGKNAFIRLLTYGHPDLKRQNATFVVSEKWGIKIYRIANCDVSPELSDSAENYNKGSSLLIASKYGKDWEDRFYKEIDEEYETEQKVIKLISSLNYVIDKETELSRSGNGLDFSLFPTNKQYVYHVSAPQRGYCREKQHMFPITGSLSTTKQKK